MNLHRNVLGAVVLEWWVRRLAKLLIVYQPTFLSFLPSFLHPIPYHTTSPTFVFPWSSIPFMRPSQKVPHQRSLLPGGGWGDGMEQRFCGSMPISPIVDMKSVEFEIICEDLPSV